MGYVLQRLIAEVAAEFDVAAQSLDGLKAQPLSVRQRMMAFLNGKLADEGISRGEINALGLEIKALIDSLVGSL
jgi:hypothetical protein